MSEGLYGFDYLFKVAHNMSADLEAEFFLNFYDLGLPTKSIVKSSCLF